MSHNSHIRQLHPGFYTVLVTLIFVHFWIAVALLTPTTGDDFTLNGPLFHIVTPLLWAVFSAVTGLGILIGMYFVPFKVTRLSLAAGTVLAIGLLINSGYILIHALITHTLLPFAVKSSFGLLTFYLALHIAGFKEPIINPASSRVGR